jgi:hypothetical protein
MSSSVHNGGAGRSVKSSLVPCVAWVGMSGPHVARARAPGPRMALAGMGVGAAHGVGRDVGAMRGTGWGRE